MSTISIGDVYLRTLDGSRWLVTQASDTMIDLVEMRKTLDGVSMALEPWEVSAYLTRTTEQSVRLVQCSACTSMVASGNGWLATAAEYTAAELRRFVRLAGGRVTATHVRADGTLVARIAAGTP